MSSFIRTCIVKSSEINKRPKVIFGEIKDFIPTTTLDKTNRKPEDWDDKIRVEILSVDQFLEGIDKMDQKHLADIH